MVVEEEEEKEEEVSSLFMVLREFDKMHKVCCCWCCCEWESLPLSLSKSLKGTKRLTKPIEIGWDTFSFCLSVCLWISFTL